MVSLNTLVAFTALAFVVIVIPGPSILFIVGRALQHGKRAALVSVVGNTGGEVAHTILVAVGIGAVIAASATAFTVLKWFGGGYLIYLGIQAIRHRREGLDVPADDDAQAIPPTSKLLSESFVVGVLNPKTIVFVAAVLPQFVDPARGAAWAQILVLGFVFALVALVSDGLYALLAGTARDWFAKSPHRLERLRATGGVMMAALGVALIASRRAA